MTYNEFLEKTLGKELLPNEVISVSVSDLQLLLMSIDELNIPKEHRDLVIDIIETFFTDLEFNKSKKREI